MNEKTVYAVLFVPDGVPRSADGDWAGIISVHESQDRAEQRAQYERSSGVWGDFSPRPDDPEYDEDCPSSDRGYRIEVEETTYFFAAP